MSDEELTGDNGEDVNQDAMADEWAAAMAEAEASEQDDVSQVELDELQDETPIAAGDNPDLDVILDTNASDLHKNLSKTVFQSFWIVLE